MNKYLECPSERVQKISFLDVLEKSNFNVKCLWGSLKSQPWWVTPFNVTITGATYVIWHYMPCNVHTWQIGERRRQRGIPVFRYSMKSSQRSWIFNKMPRLSTKLSKGQHAELKPWITFLFSQVIKVYGRDK